ncbi:hypothetical protein LCGC14_1913830, partial [marine sediment metagenome]
RVLFEAIRDCVFPLQALMGEFIRLKI